MKAKLKRLLPVLILLMGAGIWLSPALSQEYIERVADSGFTKQKRAGVPFFHDEHNEKAGVEDCSICHHVYTDGVIDPYDSSEGMECSECHLSEGDSDLSLARVYHLQCKGCHQEKKAGPVACAECHKEL